MEDKQLRTSSVAQPRAQRHYFYGWNIVGGAFLAHLSYAESTSSLLGLYINPLNKEFGWSRTAISGAVTFGRLIEGAVSPIIGPFIDRHGPRVLMVIGGIIVTLVFVALTQVNALWQFYLWRGAMLAIGFSLMGYMVTNTAISNWFIRRRGRAVAIASMGTHVGNLVMAPLILWLIIAYGWRSSWLAFAILTFVSVVIPAGLIMRRRPEDLGLHPDGINPAADHRPTELSGEVEPVSTVSPTSEPEPIWTRREVLRSGPFWILVASFSFGSLAIQGINISLAPYVQDLGFGSTIVATVLVVRSASMFVSSPAWGLLGERVELPIVRSMPFVIQGVSCVFFLLASQSGFLWLAVIINAVGFAGMALVQEVVWANYFGRLTLGMVRSTAYPIFTTCSAGGPIFMNAIFDITGSYRLAFILFINLFALSSLLMWACWAPRAAHHVRPEELDQTP